LASPVSRPPATEAEFSLDQAAESRSINGASSPQFTGCHEQGRPDVVVLEEADRAPHHRGEELVRTPSGSHQEVCPPDVALAAPRVRVPVEDHLCGKPSEERHRHRLDAAMITHIHDDGLRIVGLEDDTSECRRVSFDRSERSRRPWRTASTT
jgi:hypothetical protein